jgi:hypothetical protein
MGSLREEIECGSDAGGDAGTDEVQVHTHVLHTRLYVTPGFRQATDILV